MNLSSNETACFKSSRKEGRSPNEEGRDGMIELSRMLRVMGLHKESRNCRDCEVGRCGSTCDDKKSKTADRFSRRVVRCSVFEGAGINVSFCSVGLEWREMVQGC